MTPSLDLTFCSFLRWFPGGSNFLLAFYQPNWNWVNHGWLFRVIPRWHLSFKNFCWFCNLKKWQLWLWQQRVRPIVAYTQMIRNSHFYKDSWILKLFLQKMIPVCNSSFQSNPANMLLVVTELCSGISLTQVLQRNERGMSCFLQGTCWCKWDLTTHETATEQ